ncbi:MAG: leucine-rich repeat domain-containing protein, partial [Anaeroplasmataceae bacterium]|nr:leucine-rich repeat domain-containing protein [Anaeroplasmataceae bacterium]
TSLGTVNFKTNVIEEISKRLFYNCTSLTTVNSVDNNGNNLQQQFPQSVTKISEQAMFNCKSLPNFIVGEHIESLEAGIFGGCIELTELTLPFIGATRTAAPKAGEPTDETFGYIFGYYVTELGELNNFTNIQNYTSLYVANQNGNAYYIPTKLAKVTVTDDSDIRAYGFANVNKLQTIVLPNDGYHSVTGAEEAFTEIGAHAFESCSELVRVVNTNSDLTKAEIELPETITTIGDYAFNECVKLPYMIFPSEITTVGSYAFRNCVELQEAIFEGNKIDTLSEGVFYNCIELNEFNFPTSILHVKSYAFYNCIDLDEITVPKNVLDIDYAAFGGCHNLVEMTIPFVGQDREDDQNSNATAFGWIFGGVVVGHSINTPSALYEVR